MLILECSQGCYGRTDGRQRYYIPSQLRWRGDNNQNFHRKISSPTFSSHLLSTYLNQFGRNFSTSKFECAYKSINLLGSIFSLPSFRLVCEYNLYTVCKSLKETKQFLQITGLRGCFVSTHCLKNLTRLRGVLFPPIVLRT